MPRGDGTGPRGLGPGTGWGSGPCGAGMGRGFGRGMGWRRWRFTQLTPARVFEPVQLQQQTCPQTKEQELQLLEEEQGLLKKELEDISKRIGELKK
jgi:hypothetical protein